MRQYWTLCQTAYGHWSYKRNPHWPYTLFKSYRQDVSNILTMKFAAGLFDQPTYDPAMAANVNNPAHRAVAREAARWSARPDNVARSLAEVELRALRNSRYFS